MRQNDCRKGGDSLTVDNIIVALIGTAAPGIFAEKSGALCAVSRVAPVVPVVPPAAAVKPRLTVPKSEND